MEKLTFLSKDQVFSLSEQFDTPLFVYNNIGIKTQIDYFKQLPSAFGFTIRYSLKGNCNRFLLREIDKHGLSFDSSSGWEAMRAIAAGIEPSKILLTSQETPTNLKELVEEGMQFDACSIEQLKTYADMFPNTDISLRINPGEGTGGINRLVSGGPKSSFGIWHEYLPEAMDIIAKNGLNLIRIHQHIGSGHNPDLWYEISRKTLEMLKDFPTVTILNLGGGYRIKSFESDPNFDYNMYFEKLATLFVNFEKETGRKIHLEIEPGTAIMGNNGSLITKVIDKVDTGSEGYKMIKLNAGITETARPGLYGAKHPLVVVPKNETSDFKTENYLVMGHCCIQGDHYTPVSCNPEEVEAVELQVPSIGDFLVLERAGAYCTSMSLRNFNSFPDAAEVLVHADGSFQLIRKRQTFEHLIENETVLDNMHVLS